MGALTRRFATDASDAEDAVQEVFVELWRNAGRFDPAVASEQVFVAMIARRRLIDRRRHQKRRPVTEELPEARLEPGGGADHAEVCAEASIAARALEQLRPEQRQVVVLTTLHGLSHEEVARSTGMPLGTVKAHARRAILRVRELLKGRADATPIPHEEVAS